MEVDYFSETLLWYWFESWGVAVAFAVTVLLAVLAAARGGWNTGGLIIKTLMIAAVLSVMPLAMIRLGMNIAVSDEDTLGYLSLAGTAVSVVVGLLYILKTRSTARLTPGVSAAAEGSPEPPQDEPASETGDATATTDVAGAQTPEPQGPGQASAAWLVFRSGPNAGQSILLDPGATKIGRASDNDVVVDDPAVSRQHATIAFQQGRYVLEDAGSVGGTVVEGSPSALTNLTSGATIQLGGTEMVFMQSAANPIGAVSGAGQPAATMMPTNLQM